MSAIPLHCLRVLACLGSLLLVGVCARGQATPAEAFDPAPFLIRGQGTLPILLSAPHGGRQPLPGVPERKGEGVEQFVTVVDTGSLELLEVLVKEVERECGGKPFFVGAKFARKFVDANRPPKDAYEHPRAKQVYDAYHDELEKAHEVIFKTHGKGLLLDLHGQAKDKATIFRGTAKLSTVALLLDRHGRTALTGPKSVLGVLEAKGYKVFPKGDSMEPEQPGFTGGYIVQKYGSKKTGKLDAIQLELGGDHRSRTNRETFARDLALAIKTFAKEYLENR